MSNDTIKGLYKQSVWFTRLSWQSSTAWRNSVKRDSVDTWQCSHYIIIYLQWHNASERRDKKRNFMVHVLFVAVFLSLAANASVIITRQLLRPFRYNTFECFSFCSCSGGQRCHVHGCHCPWCWRYMWVYFYVVVPFLKKKNILDKIMKFCF